MTLPSTWLPGWPTPAEWEVKSERKVLMSDALSMKRQTRIVGGQRWGLSLKYDPMPKSEFAHIAAFLEEQRGRHGTFGIVLPPLDTNIAGNYLHADGHTKSYRVAYDYSGGNPTELISVFTNGTRKSDSFSATASDNYTAAIKIDEQVGAAGVTMELRKVSDDTANSNSITVTGGYNVGKLTAVSTTASYLYVGGTVNVTEAKVRANIVGNTVTGLVPTMLDDTDELIMSPYPVFTCSLDDDIAMVRYGSDGFVRLDVSLIERI